MAIVITDLEDQTNSQDFIIRKLTQNSYRIEETGTLVEVAADNTLLISTIVVDTIIKHSPNAKIKTKEYSYKTNDGILLTFSVKEGRLEIEQKA